MPHLHAIHFLLVLTKQKKVFYIVISPKKQFHLGFKNQLLWGRFYNRINTFISRHCIKMVFSAFLNWAISIRNCKDVTWLKNIAWCSIPKGAIMLTINLNKTVGRVWVVMYSIFTTLWPKGISIMCFWDPWAKQVYYTCQFPWICCVIHRLLWRNLSHSTYFHSCGFLSQVVHLLWFLIQ